MYLRPDTPRALAARDLSDWVPVFYKPPSGDEDDPEKDLQNWSSLIGIITAICGNVLIALALNVQRYAHIRLHRERARVRERARQAMKNAAKSQATAAGYGSASTSNRSNGSLSTPNGGPAHAHDYTDDDYAHGPSEMDPLAQSFRSGDSRWSECSTDDDDETKVTSTYLKDPYWWLGQVLITVGEMGNFLAYGFAPASIVSPLGVVALVSNCVIAPLFFKEIFRPRDFWGVIIAVAGAVTVVLSAKQEETKLGPHEVWDAITSMEFEIYMGISVVLITVLMWLSPRYGNRTILIDLGLVGLFGGYTALATKGVSSMLSSTLLGAFTTPVTYVLLFVLLSTAIMQVRYVNKALQRFDSTQVIPIQFVLFTLCVIIGSAVLYRDFERTSSEQALKFVGGCLLTFFGVFLITSGRPRHDEDEDTLSDAEGIEETIGLSEQGHPVPQSASRHSSRRDSGSERSRRSSRVSFKEGAVNKPLAALSGTGFPSSRVPPTSSSAMGPTLLEEDNEDSPFLVNPWKENFGDASGQQNHPGLGQHTVSSESVVSVVSSAAVSDGEYQPQSSSTATPLNQPQQIPHVANVDRPATPRAPPPAPLLSTSRPHSHHFGGPMISPSPFSSTLSAVVTDKLLAHIDSSPTLLRKVASRRSRPSLRNSLFVPQDEFDSDSENEQQQSLVPRSAVERATTSRRDLYGLSGGEDADEEGGDAEAALEASRSFRGRARSLSHTLGGLFGVHVKRERARRDTGPPTPSSGGGGGGGNETRLLFESRRNNAERSTDTLP